MFQFVTAALRPPFSASVQRAGIPHDPATIFIYILLLVVPWVIWEGLRTSGKGGDAEPSADGQDPEASPSSGEKPREQARKKARKKRDPDRINWLA